MPKLHIRYVEFYITNVCNFECAGCNRFNNYAFSGRQHWKDLSHVYQRWSNILELDTWTLMGGEPMTSPDYLDWIKGLRNFWPRAEGNLLTNGHYLNEDNRELYNLCHHSNGKFMINIGLHNVHRASDMIQKVKRWMRGQITVTREPENIRDLPGFDLDWKNSYNAVKDQSWPNCDTIDQWANLPEFIKRECHDLHNLSPEILSDLRKEYLLVDENGVRVKIWNENYFYQSALIEQPKSNSFRLHASDPVQAHAVCPQAIHKCYHFINGELYKCGPVALLKEFDKQYNIEVNDQDRALMNSYVPATADMPLGNIKLFLENIDQVIDQCKFCPENYEFKEIQSIGKKPMMFTKKKHDRI